MQTLHFFLFSAYPLSQEDAVNLLFLSFSLFSVPELKDVSASVIRACFLPPLPLSTSPSCHLSLFPPLPLSISPSFHLSLLPPLPLACLFISVFFKLGPSHSCISLLLNSSTSIFCFHPHICLLGEVLTGNDHSSQDVYHIWCRKAEVCTDPCFPLSHDVTMIMSHVT
ncbi:unnamed protein product [Acanthosepion pharaonis]|uniref:Uncharacterized protein n=1 Tax=Acanthosepion pharaonis TaxID=158019 RepID=A0A812E6E0_ACAPH|nr:unnamed protein product [Sepia pharaonis]